MGRTEVSRVDTVVMKFPGCQVLGRCLEQQLLRAGQVPLITL